MKVKVLAATLFSMLFTLSYANTNLQAKTKYRAPQPVDCIKSDFNVSGSKHWKSIKLTLRNECSQPVDFQDASISFISNTELNTNFWGAFDPLSYPDNVLRIVSQPYGDKYKASLSLHFPNYEGANSTLPVNKSIQIQYGAATDGHIGNASVYLNPTNFTGNIVIQNLSAKPANVSQNYALVHLTNNGQVISEIQLPWQSHYQISNLAPGDYAIHSDQITDANGNEYIGTANPATIYLNEGQTATSNISFEKRQQLGQVQIELDSKPEALSAYFQNPSVLISETNGSESSSVILNWGTAVTISNLSANTRYSLNTPSITFNNNVCQPSFNPEEIVASSSSLPISKLSYSCSPIIHSTVTLSVQGAPDNLNSLRVSLTPNDGSAATIQDIPLTNGSGSIEINLPEGVIYQVSSEPVDGYNVTYSPQPLIVNDGSTEQITLAKNDQTPVAQNGRLHVCQNHLCNEQNQIIQLKGMSSHGIQWYGWLGSNTVQACLTPNSLDTLTKDWKASVMRISMYVQEDGYETDPAGFTQQVNQLIDELSDRGVYVIVDWHMLSPGDPMYNLEKAKTFFKEIATKHKGKKNLFYEIANEPNGVSWSRIKSYANNLIPEIRAIDPNSIIIVGTPAWSSLGVSEGRSPQDIINSPINYPNIMYTFHFYAASHQDYYLQVLDSVSDTLPIFVTEFGTQTYSGDGANDFVMSDRYMALMRNKHISWSNWNLSDDFRTGAVWKSNTCRNDIWTDDHLKVAGIYIKDKILNNG